MLKFVYSFFLGLLLVVFIGMGVATFYEAPKAPEYPKALELRVAPEKNYTASETKLKTDYDSSYKAYDKRQKAYNRNVSISVLVAAIILLVLSLTLQTRIGLLADGLLLGGTFTLIYSIGRSFAGDNPKYSFMVVTIGLLVTVVVGYMKFLKPQQLAGSSKSKK